MNQQNIAVTSCKGPVKLITSRPSRRQTILMSVLAHTILRSPCFMPQETRTGLYSLSVSKSNLAGGILSIYSNNSPSLLRRDSRNKNRPPQLISERMEEDTVAKEAAMHRLATRLPLYIQIIYRIREDRAPIMEAPLLTIRFQLAKIHLMKNSFSSRIQPKQQHCKLRFVYRRRRSRISHR